MNFHDLSSTPNTLFSEFVQRLISLNWLQTASTEEKLKQYTHSLELALLFTNFTSSKQNP